MSTSEEIRRRAVAGDARLQRLLLTQQLIAEGAAARRQGFRIENCPRFRSADWAFLWRRGWTLEHERRLKWTDPPWTDPLAATDDKGSSPGHG